MMRRAFITGISGQDGSYLAELLLEEGYEVFGMIRRTSSDVLERLQPIRDKICLVHGDLLDPMCLSRVIADIQPHEIYNLAAQSFVPTSFEQPILTAEVTALGVTRVLDAIRESAPKARFFQASSSEMFGQAVETPQSESTPFHPRSPYAAAKIFGHHMTVNYRESYGLFACAGIMFNHESPRRHLDFVTRKITNGVARIALGLDGELHLGNLDARRDWGFAPDYVRAMWLMLQQDTPDDYVLGTGESHSVQEFVELAFAHVGMDWRKHVLVNPKLFRPADVDVLRANPAKARRQLGWEPQVTFRELVALMVDADLRRLRRLNRARAHARPAAA